MEDLNENKVMSDHTEEMDTEKSKKFNIQKHCLKHILFIMALTGTYNWNNAGEKSITRRLLFVYSLFIFFALLFLVGKTAAGYAFIEKSDFFGHTVVFGWSVACFITFLLALRMNHSRNGNQQRSFEFWDTKIAPQMRKLGIKFDHDNFRRKQIFICTIAVFIMIVLIAFCSIQLSGLLGDGSTGTATIPFEPTPLMRSIQAVIIAAGCLQANTPMFYMVTVCYMITLSFRGFNEYLETQMCESACRLPQTMQTIREYYTDLCRTVTEFDKDFKYLLGNTIFWNIAMSLFVLYVLLREDMSSYGVIGLVSYIFWLSLSVGSTVALSVMAALVHETAHAPLDTIYYINVQDITVEKLAQLNLFLSKLTGTQVGFSTCGLLIITKEFILTIAGVFLTYFAVLYTL